MTSNANKSPNAFRTISEVADSMGVPQHVLRFWESKFSQISPMKRGGGRRYYRPEDIEIIQVIRKLLHDDGYTIKGAQKLLKEQGIKSILETIEVESKDAALKATPKTENTYESQILNITKKNAQANIQINIEDADMLTSLKKIRIRLETIRQNLKA
ncbi:MAG: MerR family transcriptional regulator [Alphaproteobacteria bacterium]|nr:MAG: MerR family transcriptional regulator [Alphaproteobacteria bacterium]